ncbi:hypothetical protein GXW82_08380 [Streptacidiphilus sp. 4-A2]|nr:hypothetical protein [Streptacidiphilus sp. 4-A2]
MKDPGTNLGDELEASGKTWKAYEQGMGTPCNTTTQYDSYYEPDDAPFINYTDVSGNAARCAAHLFDTSQLTTDLKSAATTPNFSWIAADDYYDGESSATAARPASRPRTAGCSRPSRRSSPPRPGPHRSHCSSSPGTRTARTRTTMSPPSSTAPRARYRREPPVRPATTTTAPAAPSRRRSACPASPPTTPTPPR